MTKKNKATEIKDDGQNRWKGNPETQMTSIVMLETPFWSLNQALKKGEIVGIPLTEYEVYADAGVGKTTFCISLMGHIGRLLNNKSFSVVPIEPMDIDAANNWLNHAEFRGGVDLIVEEKDELIVNRVRETSADDEYFGGIFDSLGAVSPMEETANSIEDKNMGRRGQLVSKLGRAIIHSLRYRETPYIYILINHKLKAMDKWGTEYTPGGDGKKYLSRVRIRLRKIQVQEKALKSYVFDDGSFVLRGIVTKYNYDQGGKEFDVFVLSGRGLDIGMSAFWDCYQQGIIEKRNGGYYYIGEQTFGRVNDIIEKAKTGNKKFFQPFIDALRNVDGVQKSNEDEDEE